MNINIKRVLLLFSLFIAGTNSGYCGTGAHPKKMMRLDSTTAITSRHLDSIALVSYSHQPEFNYREETINPSAWVRFWAWFWHWLGNLFQRMNGSGGARHFWYYFFVALKYGLLISGLAALVFVILKLAGINLLNILQKRSAVVIPYSASSEDIHTIDFDNDIGNAIAQHNYRLAVRLLYLQTLKKLSDAQLIDWQMDKTNSAYVNELLVEQQRLAFSQLTLQFEYTWYGNFTIDAALYNRIQTSFTNFMKGVA